MRLFIGELFKVQNYKYFAPLSSPKPKFLQMKNKIDFLRIDNGKLGAINFNNMIPVKIENIIVIDLNKECITKAESKYQNLLKDQLKWLNRNDEKLYSRAQSLYDKYINGTLANNIRSRCCDFKLLEKKCEEYSEIDKK